MELITIGLLVIISVLFVIGSVIVPFRNVENGMITRKGIRLRSIYLSAAGLCLFAAQEIYQPNLLCIPVLLFFIGLFWAEYLLSPFRNMK